MGALVGRAALVTGGGQGIARAVCEALAAEGASISIADINAEAGAAAAGAIVDAGGRAHFTRCNVAKPEDVERSVAEATEAFGRIDVLVNAAQYFAPPRTIERTSMKDWDLSHATGPLATLRFMQACLPHLKERGGSIVNFTSGSALTGMKYTAAYSAAKGAITALSKVAANEWAVHGIRVNVLCPFALTPVQERMIGTVWDNYTRTAACSPMGRGASPREEIAPVVVFLASDAARFLTGTVVHADGGLNELSPVDYGETPGVFADET
ncbi:MAG: SDR family oxidoreductase [Deltaproteobacteria bacterium]|nr:SDR family oxidoreductase [Deltaproteobacteria bacterium]